MIRAAPCNNNNNNTNLAQDAVALQHPRGEHVGGVAAALGAVPGDELVQRGLVAAVVAEPLRVLGVVRVPVINY